MKTLLIVLIVLYLLVGLFLFVVGTGKIIKDKDRYYFKLIELNYIGRLLFFMVVCLAWGPILIKVLRDQLEV